jgi:hypothetical protein
LLDENWIGKRILDARGYQVMQAINESMGSLKVVFLPSIFHTQLCVAFRPRRFSTAMKALRGSLLEDLPCFIPFVFNKDLTHWAPCVVSVEDRIVRQGNSLEWASDADMLPMIRGLLGDITRESGEWKETLLAVAQQGAGSGSCGIVAMSAIEWFIVRDSVPWSTHVATQFRHRWLGELVKFHLKAIQSSDEVCLRFGAGITML